MKLALTYVWYDPPHTAPSMLSRKSHAKLAKYNGRRMGSHDRMLGTEMNDHVPSMHRADRHSLEMSGGHKKWPTGAFLVDSTAK